MTAPVSWSDRSLTCSDGVELVARVWQPGEGGPWPVLLMRQPYGRAIASTPTYAHPSWYAAQGFLVVVQDVRGSGGSQGCFAGFAQEARDSAATVLWARTLPGSNGRVGTYGFSYQGLTQLLNHDGQQRPEALPDALAPAMCGLLERDHWSVSGGAHWWLLGLGWGLQLAALQCRRRGDSEGWREIRRSLESQAFTTDGLALLQRLDPDNMVLAWLRRDPAALEDWPAHAVDGRLWQRPMLLIGGWLDPHLEGVLDLYERARCHGGDPWLRIGAWSHLGWQGGLDRLQLDFFRWALAGAPAPPASPLLLQCQRSQRWLTAAANPTAPPGPWVWGLQSTGLAAMRLDEGLLLQGRAGSGQVVMVHDPWRPAPGVAGHLALNGGQDDRALLDARSDVVCFQTPPLVEALLLQGRPLLSVTAAADQPGFDLVATLAVVTATGAVRQLSLGVLRLRGETALIPQPREVVLQPLLAKLEPGECLRLSLAASAWPLLAVNPGDGSLPLGGVGPDHRVITLQLDLDQAELRLRPLPIGANPADCDRLETPH